MKKRLGTMDFIFYGLLQKNSLDFSIFNANIITILLLATNHISLSDIDHKTTSSSQVPKGITKYSCYQVQKSPELNAGISLVGI